MRDDERETRRVRVVRRESEVVTCHPTRGGLRLHVVGRAARAAEPARGATVTRCDCSSDDAVA